MGNTLYLKLDSCEPAAELLDCMKEEPNKDSMSHACYGVDCIS